MSPSCDCGPNKPFWTLKVLFFWAIHGASTSLLMFFHWLWSLRCGLSTSTVATPQEHSSNQTATHCSILLNGICPTDELKHQQWWFLHAHVLCCNTYLFWSGLSNLEKVERLWKVFFGHQWRTKIWKGLQNSSSSFWLDESSSTFLFFSWMQYLYNWFIGNFMETS